MPSEIPNIQKEPIPISRRTALVELSLFAGSLLAACLPEIPSQQEIPTPQDNPTPDIAIPEMPNNADILLSPETWQPGESIYLQTTAVDGLGMLASWNSHVFAPNSLTFLQQTETDAYGFERTRIYISGYTPDDELINNRVQGWETSNDIVLHHLIEPEAATNGETTQLAVIEAREGGIKVVLRHPPDKLIATTALGSPDGHIIDEDIIIIAQNTLVESIYLSGENPQLFRINQNFATIYLHFINQNVTIQSEQPILTQQIQWGDPPLYPDGSVFP